MRRFTALLLAGALGLGSIAGCGSEEEPPTASEFCADHQGIRAGSEEPDGDVTCNDGTEYEAEGESSSSSKSKSKKKKRK